MPDENRLPVEIQPIGSLGREIGDAGLPPSLRVLLDDSFYGRVKQLAAVMSHAQGITPKHLIDKAEACFAIINIALDSRLSPWFVARNTYQTPGGQIGHNGALVQSILEQSGRFVGSPTFEYRGDWSVLTGKFTILKGQSGGEYVKPNWGPQDAIGLGIIVRWMVRGERVARAWPGEKEPFWLTQCFPLNSPLWATDPKTQIAYLAIRRFATLTSPGILGAAAFDHDDLLDASERAINVTPPPRPRREEFSDAVVPPAREPVGHDVIDCDGITWLIKGRDQAAEKMEEVLRDAIRRGPQAIAGTLEDNEEVLLELGLTEITETAREAMRPKRRRATKDEMEERRKATESLSGQVAVDPEPKPPEGRMEPVDGAGSSSEANAQQSPPAGAERSGARGEEDEQTRASAAEAGGNPARVNYTVLPVPKGRDGKPDYRAWWIALFLPKLRQSANIGEYASWLGDNADAIRAYNATLTPAGVIAAQKELDDIVARLQRAS